MKKKTLAVLSAAVLAAAFMAGCGNKTASEPSTSPTAQSETGESKPEETKSEEKKPEVKDDRTSVVVIGGNGSGLIAAVQAVREGADPSKVIILEAGEELGKDIASKEEFVNAADTYEQYEQEIEDSYEQFLADIMKSGKDKNDEELASFVAESGEAAVTWLNDMGIEMTGVDKKEGASAARSYSATGRDDLRQVLADTLKKEIEDKKIQVKTGTKVEEILLDEEGAVSGVKVSGKDGQETIECITLIAADDSVLPLLKDFSVKYVNDAGGKEVGVVVDTCAEVKDETDESIPGLYAIGSLIETAVHGEKALPGNEMTSMILFGVTAGTEAQIYADDNKIR